LQTSCAPPAARRLIDLTELARQYLTMQTNRGRTSGTLEKYE
jgi:hypothetical protein